MLLCFQEHPEDQKVEDGTVVPGETLPPAEPRGK